MNGQQADSPWSPVLWGFGTYAALSYLDRDKDPNRLSERIAKWFCVACLAAGGIFIASILVMVLFGIGV